MSTSRLNMLFPALLVLIIFVVNPVSSAEVGVSNSQKNCTVKYGKRLLVEDEVITINAKLYKVENCQLQRAFHFCGTHLWYTLNIVCEAIESNPKVEDPFALRFRRFTRQKLLSEACCLAICTVHEMTRYCPL